ncbi:MAG TPA: hypothetical protein PKC97_07260 [Burkholderiaceae bacterium]|nr:hypothetical protein [Burkholderiaceae bacterium]
MSQAPNSGRPASASLASKLAAAGEAATGLALLAAPASVVALLLGEPATGVAIAVARVLGMALLALALACWPGPARLGMLAYSVAVAVYLGALGLSGAAAGLLLWPAVLLHLALAALLVREWRRESSVSG